MPRPAPLHWRVWRANALLAAWPTAACGSSTGAHCLRSRSCSWAARRASCPSPLRERRSGCSPQMGSWQPSAWRRERPRRRPKAGRRCSAGSTSQTALVASRRCQEAAWHSAGGRVCGGGQTGRSAPSSCWPPRRARLRTAARQPRASPRWPCMPARPPSWRWEPQAAAASCWVRCRTCLTRCIYSCARRRELRLWASLQAAPP
mmetsp:Transcript_71959/g.227462  ORF Transcript_71959/g.227462 Transcript_71959/m.227462 type:complete len:204 (-) Transcript_71959:1358-1969(-)